ncbi:MAG: hypothetical protein K8S87_08875, partial [Planctomycetes bacterium]|nr:hypothetical protein [Planctomycetota bacterium]
MTPTSYNICIRDDEKCTCCDCVPPETSENAESECSICSKTLTKQDFINKNATYSHDQIFCLDCLKASRILQKDKEIYNCDYCGTELTPLDFLEDNAEIKRMLIVCSSCIEKHFATDAKVQNEKIAESKKTKKKHKKKSGKGRQKSGISETVQSSLKALEVAVKNADGAVKNNDETVKDNKIASKLEIIDASSDEKSVETEKDTKKTELTPKSMSHRLGRDKHASNNMDYRAALGCLVFLVLILSAGISYLIFSKYSVDKNKATEDLAFIMRAVREKQDELSESVERFGNRLYHLEQLEMQRSSDR